MATAIFVKTESTDSYLWCVSETLSKTDVDEFLRDQLEDEYDYVDDLMVEYSK